MRTPGPTRIGDIYQTDLERHLFAPRARSARGYWRRPSFEAVSARLRHQLTMSWERIGKALAAMYLV